MSKTYVVPDLHGRRDLLSKFLNTHYDYKSKLIFLGDYIDRGQDSRGVIQIVRRLVLECGAVALRGNHEQMFYGALCDPADETTKYLWCINGGVETIESYGGPLEEEMLWDADWVGRLPKYHEDAHRVYVHASVDSEFSLDEHTDQMLLWGRYHTGEDGGGYRGKHVVHGHTPKRQVELFQNRTNLDIGAVFRGTLAVGVFDDDIPGGPVDILHVDMTE